MTVDNKAKEQKDNDAYSKNFARIPNMLFASFKHLTKEEKFLYCTLKSVYWDAKPRYVSLRKLGEMTGYSRSALANMLPRLHSCNLVHAEIRREKDKFGKEQGNAKYNITILDIWELNREYYSCPQERQDLLDPSLILVHENGQACPPNKPSLSMKNAKLVHENVRVRAQVERAKKDKERVNTPLKKSSMDANNNASSVSKKVTEKGPLTEVEHSLWTILCEARKLQEKRLYRELEVWSKPTKLQREQITSIIQKVQEQGFSISRLTPEMIEQSWIDEMEEKKYLKKDPEWKVGNVESMLLAYLKQYAPAQPETQMVVVEKQGSDQDVLWTKTPGKIGNDIASFWTILEWMPESEAHKYHYGEYGTFSVEEIEQYKQLSQMAIAG